MSEEPKLRRIEDLEPELESMTADQAEAAEGGILIGMLLPAVRKVREAAAGNPGPWMTPIKDGTSNTVMGD